MPLVPELGRQKLVDLFDFKASVVSSRKGRSSYIVRFCFEKQSKTKQILTKKIKEVNLKSLWIQWSIRCSLSNLLSINSET